MSKSNADLPALHTRERLSQYAGRGEDYARSRPSYPPTAIDTILKGFSDLSRLRAADIGAGTGIASRLLAERGIRVIAIEPSASMRQAAHPDPLIEFHDATAEQTNLRDASVDLLTCFQAFHWFNPAPTLAEFRRILKSSGRLALVWNGSGQGNFSEEHRHLVRKARSSHGPLEKQKQAGPFSHRVKPLISSPHFVHVCRYTFTNQRELNLSGLIGYTLSKSSVPRTGHAHQQLISDLQELHARWADEHGLVSLNYSTAVYLAEPRSRGSFIAGWRRLNRAVSYRLFANKRN